MVRPAKFAGILILDVSWSLKPIVAPPVAPLHARDFSFGNSHSAKPYERTARPRRVLEVALIVAIGRAGQGANGKKPLNTAAKRKPSAVP